MNDRLLSPEPEPRPIKGLKIKKILTYITIAVFFLSGGIEYSVILPTCWDFMSTRFQAEKWIYGLTLSAMSMSNLLIGPVMGSIYDHTHQTKAIIIILLSFQIGGNFMYFAATSKYMVLGSRFIVGIGISGGAVLFGELARTTSKKQRTSVFSLFMSTRQIGLVIGPAFNLFLRICDFKIGPFIVDKYTAPALFMMIVFFIMAIMFVFCFFQLPTVFDEEVTVIDDKHSPRFSSPIIASTGQDITIEVYTAHSNESTSSSERSSLLSPTDTKSKSPSINNSNTSREILITSSYGSIDPDRLLSTKSFSCQRLPVIVYITTVKIFKRGIQLLTEEIVILLIMILFSMMAQMILETGFVPFAEKQFGWKELETSLFYSAAGFQIILVFITTTILSRIVSDRYLIVIGLVLELFSHVWYVSTLGNGKPSNWTIEKFVIGTFIGLTGLPFFIVGASSLYSKMLHPQMQGFGQGVRRSMVSLASILGPLWAGASFELEDQFGYYPYFGVSLVLMVIILILLPFSFSKLKESNYTKLKPIQ